MNKASQSVILSLVLAGVTQVSTAQRSTDLQTTITSPATGLILPPGGEPVHITFDFKNNGPGNLVTGDTLFFALSLSAQDLVPVVMTQALNNGQTVPLDLGFGIQNPGNLAADQTVDVCVIVLDPNSMGVTANGQPVHVSYNDPNIGNNQHCISVTVKKAVTGIGTWNDNPSRKLTLYPNPATTEITLYAEPEQAVPVHVIISDITGREVLRKDCGRVKPDRHTPIRLQVGDLSPGHYIVSMQAGAIITTSKLLIQR